MRCKSWGRGLEADGRIQRPQSLGVAMASQAAEGVKASSALEDTASRLLALRDTIQAAGRQKVLQGQSPRSLFKVGP